MSATTVALKIGAGVLALGATFYTGKVYGRYRESQDHLMTLKRNNERAILDLDELLTRAEKLEAKTKAKIEEKIKALKERVTGNKVVMAIWADIQGDVDEIKTLIEAAAK